MKGAESLQIHALPPHVHSAFKPSTLRSCLYSLNTLPTTEARWMSDPHLWCLSTSASFEPYSQVALLLCVSQEASHLPVPCSMDTPFPGLHPWSCCPPLPATTLLFLPHASQSNFLSRGPESCTEPLTQFRYAVWACVCIRVCACTSPGSIQSTPAQGSRLSMHLFWFLKGILILDFIYLRWGSKSPPQTRCPLLPSLPLSLHCRRSRAVLFLLSSSGRSP